jgi:hypothetical protein
MTANNVSSPLDFYGEACITSGGTNTSATCYYRNHYYPIADSVTVTIAKVACGIEDPTPEQIGKAYIGKYRYCGGDLEVESSGPGSITLSVSTCDGVDLGCFEPIPDTHGICIDG